MEKASIIVVQQTCISVQYSKQMNKNAYLKTQSKEKYFINQIPQSKEKCCCHNNIQYNISTSQSLNLHSKTVYVYSEKIMEQQKNYKLRILQEIPNIKTIETIITV